jgi:hypothetical protein
MAVGRVVLVITLLLVAALGAWFAVVRWEDANKVATAASALGAVAAVGVAVWAAMRSPRPEGRVRVRGTGSAVARGGGSANTGVIGGGTAQVRNTGDAEADGGDANTGVRM